MKKALSGLTLLLLTATAQADLSANLGYMSEYHFRGILQKVSSVSGGIDYESGGFYVGTWAADVGDGLEVDGYFGYGADVGDVSLSVGYTGYFYTGDFDDTYQEINLGAGFGMLTLDVAIGKFDGDFDPVAPGDQDAYTYAALTLENNACNFRAGRRRRIPRARLRHDRLRVRYRHRPHPGQRGSHRRGRRIAGLHDRQVIRSQLTGRGGHGRPSLQPKVNRR